MKVWINKTHNNNKRKEKKKKEKKGNKLDREILETDEDLFYRQLYYFRSINQC